MSCRSRAAVSELLREFSIDEHVLRPRVPRRQVMLYGDYASAGTAGHDAAIRQAIEETHDDVAYIYRHFPQAPASERAAECAVAAAAQGRFWDMHVRLLTHQTRLDDASLVEHAMALRLDVARFLRDIAGELPRRKVRSDIRAGHAVGITCAPGIFVLGRRVPAEAAASQVLGYLWKP